MKVFNVGDIVVADNKYLCKIVNIGKDDKDVTWYECELIDATIASGVTREFTIHQLNYPERK